VQQNLLQRSDYLSFPCAACTTCVESPQMSTDPINSKHNIYAQASTLQKQQRWCAGEFTRGAANAVQTILRTEGVQGLFAGYGSFMLRDLPFDAIEFVAYEQLKKSWVKYKGSDIRPHESAVIGELLWILRHKSVSAMCKSSSLTEESIRGRSDTD